MASIVNFNPSTIGGLSVGVDPYTTGNQTNDFQGVGAGNYVIPAGKYRVRVHNTGLLDITVNSDTVKPGERWEASAFNNAATQKVDYTPEVTIIVPANGSANYMWEQPS